MTGRTSEGLEGGWGRRGATLSKGSSAGKAFEVLETCPKQELSNHRPLSEATWLHDADMHVECTVDQSP